MPPVIVATPGAPNANSYLDLVEAQNLIDYRLSSGSWSERSDDDRARALILATRAIDRHRFDGLPLRPGQALAWPRTGQPASWDKIPEDVREACLSQAIALLGPQDGHDRASLQAQGVVSFTVGSHSETFSGTGAGSGLSTGGLCPEAANLISGLITRTLHLVGPRETAIDSQQRGWGPWT